MLCFVPLIDVPDVSKFLKQIWGISWEMNFKSSSRRQLPRAILIVVNDGDGFYSHDCRFSWGKSQQEHKMTWRK